MRVGSWESIPAGPLTGQMAFSAPSRLLVGLDEVTAGTDVGSIGSLSIQRVGRGVPKY